MNRFPLAAAAVGLVAGGLAVAIATNSGHQGQQVRQQPVGAAPATAPPDCGTPVSRDLVKMLAVEDVWDAGGDNPEHVAIAGPDCGKAWQTVEGGNLLSPECGAFPWTGGYRDATLSLMGAYGLQKTTLIGANDASVVETVIQFGSADGVKTIQGYAQQCKSPLDVKVLPKNTVLAVEFNGVDLSAAEKGKLVDRAVKLAKDSL